MRIGLKQLPLRFRRRVSQTVQAADSLGLTIYLVGGPVRDLLLCRACRDLDLAVEGDALALARRLAAGTGADVSEYARFNTATLTWPEGAQLDLAGTRTEIYSAPAALPKVSPADIRADLRRRDFSINAMALALNGRTCGELLDLFQGQEDLKNRRVRILHPESFRDDPTRLFRAVRFEKRLGFRLEAQTRLACCRALEKKWLGQLSPARVFQELRQVLQERDYASCLQRLASLGVLAQVLPGLKPVSASLAKRLEKGLAISRKGRNPDVDEELLRFLALAAPVSLKSWQRRFPLPRAWAAALRFQEKQASWLKVNTSGPEALSATRWAARLETWPAENLILAMAEPPKSPWGRGIQNYLAQRAQSRPGLTGADLKKMGYAPGPRFGEMLAALQQARLAGKLATRADERKYLLKQFPLWKK